MDTLRQLLCSELLERKKNNPQYSLRSFSKNLNLSPSLLSMVLSGKRKLSQEKLLTVAQKIGLSPLQTLDLLTPEKITAEDKSKKFIKENQFQFISKWQHYAIMSLSNVKNHKADTRWISKHLGINEIEARECLNRLESLGLIKIQNGKIIECFQKTTTSEDIPSEAVRNFHKGILDKAKKSLDEVTVENREIASIVLSFNKEDLKKAKNEIRHFQEFFANKFESKKKADDVYAISVQLFPLTQNI